ncbi:MAG: disulfide bond formation protein B [Steroidobacteraceae bacterium]
MSRRSINVVGVFACVAMLGYALYAEKVLGLEPCPLCMFQRVGVLLLGFAFLLAALHHPRGQWGARSYAVLIALAAAVPAGVALRHLYIQNAPPGSVPACGATLDYMLDVFPLLEVVRQVLTGGGECAKIDWSLLGISMPGWVLIGALALGVTGAVSNWQVPRDTGPRFAI